MWTCLRNLKISRGGIWTTNIVPQASYSRSLLKYDYSGESFLGKQIPTNESAIDSRPACEACGLYFAAASPLGPAPMMQTLSTPSLREVGSEPIVQSSGGCTLRCVKDASDESHQESISKLTILGQLELFKLAGTAAEPQSHR